MEYINEPMKIDETNYLSFCEGLPCDGDTDKNCTECHNDACVSACNGGCKHKGWWGWWCIETKEDV